MTKTWRRLLTTAAVTLALPLVAACGQDLPTDQVYTPGIGTNDRSSSVDILHAVVVTEVPGEGVFIAGLANGVDTDDQLTGVSGAGADTALSTTPTAEVTIPGRGFVQLADGGGVLVSGDRIQAGNVVQMTITFANGEAVTMDVPVVLRTRDFADVEIPEDPTATPAGTPTGLPTDGATETTEG